MLEWIHLLQILIGMAAPFLVPLWLWAWRKRSVLLYFALYGLFYVGLSLNGQYHPYIGGASDGSQEWYPWRMENQHPSPGGRIKSGPSPLGYFYIIPLHFDQKYWHRTIPGENNSSLHAHLPHL